MIYQFNEPVHSKAISDLREAVGRNRMDYAYENPLMASYCHIAVYQSDQLIGFVNCVSNGVTDAYIQDLMVHPDYQNKGVGTELMNRMIAYLKEKRIYMISVLYEENLKPFYEKFGFHPMLCGQMETFREE